MLLFYTPWKHQKTFRFFDVFRRYRKVTSGYKQFIFNSLQPGIPFLYPLKTPGCNGLRTSPTKWWNLLKQFVRKLATNCLSVFNHFVKLVLKVLWGHIKSQVYLALSQNLLVLCDRILLAFIKLQNNPNFVWDSVSAMEAKEQKRL